MNIQYLKYISIVVLVCSACNNTISKKVSTNPVAIKEETITYSMDSVSMIGFIAYDSSTDAKRPIILIIHEWWGLNDYVKSRARQLANLGYLAIAIDMYGNGQLADNPEKAGQMAAPFYKNPGIAKQRFDAALAKIKNYANADTTNIAAIGYCFGGGMALNIARLGENLKGVVSFHGSLLGTPLDKKLLKANILICHGEADQFVNANEVALFKGQMDSISAPYTFKSYPNATHAFTNPNATAMGEKFGIPIAYNAQADTASWNDMTTFLNTIFK